MTYNRNAYRGRGGYRGSNARTFTPGRVARPNKRPGECRACHEEIPAGAGHLWREADGAWSVVHVPESQGGWLMHPEPVRGGCPEATDKRNAELHASGFFGPDAPAPASERDHIAAMARTYNPVQAASARSGSKYAYLPDGTRMTMSSRRCEDAPCCGCCD